MCKKRIVYFAFVILMYKFSTHSAYAEMLIKLKTNYFNQGEVNQIYTELYFGNGVMKATETKNFDMIYNLEKNSVTNVDHNKKIYRVLDEDFSKLLEKKVLEVKTRMQEMISKAPNDKRPMLENMMKEQLSQWVKAKSDLVLNAGLIERKTEKQEQQFGYLCQIYEFYNSKDEKIKEYCMISWSGFNSKYDIRKMALGINDFIENGFSRFSYMHPKIDQLSYFSDVLALNGMPLIVRYFKDGVMIKESIVKNISYKDLDSNFFQPPSSYRKLGINIH